MANDNRRSNKVKEDDNKSKKKGVTPDASPASSSRRSSRGTKESPIKENQISTRKSSRLEKRNVSSTTPGRGKAEKTNEQTITPTKQHDRRKKLDVGISAVNLRSRGTVSPATSDMKSKKRQVVGGGRKRKRIGACINKDLSKPPSAKTEESDDKDKEVEEKSSESHSSSSSCREVEKPDSFKYVDDIDGSDDDCSDSNGKESTEKASKRQCMTSDQNESKNDGVIDPEQDRTPCEAVAVAEIVEKNNVVSRIDTSICIACKKLRCGHLPLVVESVWDTREVEVSEAQGLQKQKQYFVKYKGLAHIHNQWITETQLLLDAPLLAESYTQNGSVKWNEEWTVPHQLLKKRLLLSLDRVRESQENTEVLNYRHEWLVQWQGLDYEQATWESENISVLDSPEGRNLIKDYEKNHGNAKKYDSSDNDRIEEIPVKLPTIFAGCPPGMDNIHSSYIKNLHDAWNKGHISIVFDDQERSTRIVLFILSLKSVSLPLLLITRHDSLSQWEAMFSKLAPFNAFNVSIEETHDKTSCKLLHVREDGGQLAFQLLLYPVDAFVKDLDVLKAIKWEAVIVDESQSSDISSHFSHIKSLSTYKRLLVFCGPLGVSNLDVMPLVECGVLTKTELADISKLKETLSKLIAYECKSSSSKFVEYWVPVQISNVQLEQYCSMLLSNAMALSACSKSVATGALHDILVSNRKCCDHPYIVDQSLQAVLNKDLEPVKFLDVGIKASGKLQFLDVILPELRKRQLRVLIVFHPLSGSGKDSTSIGDILDDFVRQRFGADSYERVDAGMMPSKKQVALSNFNNKETGRFIFLLEHRACLPSIKLSSIDTIIIFDSDWNPANDLRVLQRIAIDSQSEQILTFRLYTSLTLEEKILRLAEHNVTIDSKLQNISRSTSDKLLMGDAAYLFKKLDEFHNDLNVSSDECWWNELIEEFVDLLSYKCNEKDAGKLKITRAKPICGKNVTVQNELDGESHTFWRKLLAGRDPCWKYLSRSTPRQRSSKRPQYFEETSKKTNVVNDDVGRKRKKTTNNIIEPEASKPGGIANSSVDPVASKPVIGGIIKNTVDPVAAKPVIGVANNTVDPVASKPVVDPVASKPVVDPVASKPVIEGEMSFRDQLKLKISNLCEVLKLSEDVKMTVERFLDYVIENYRVNKEPENTLHAFLISLCWIGSGLLKHKLDRKQSISLANKHLDFCCKEDEANSVCIKLEFAKEMFLLHTDNQKKTVVSKDTIPNVKIKISDSPSNDDDSGGGGSGGDCNQKDEDRNINNLVLGSGQYVLTDLVNKINNSKATPLQRGEEPCLPSENQSNIHLSEHRSDTQNPLVSESSAQAPNQHLTQRGSNQLNGNRGAPRKKPYDPLQAELERLCDLKNTYVKIHDAIKLKIKSDHEKELAEMIAQINAKYEARNQDADAAFQSKKKEVETCFNRVVTNKVLAEAFRSKCIDLSSIDPSEIQGLQNPPQFKGQARSNGVTFSSSPAQSSRNQQVTGLQPPLQIVNQSSQLFSTPPVKPPSNNTDSYTRPPPSNTIPYTIPSPSNTNPATRPPPSTVIPAGTPSKPPFTPSIPSRPPPGVNPTTPSTRPPSTTIPASTPSKPPFTPSIPGRPPPGVNPITAASRPMNPITATSRPPSNIIPAAPSARNVRMTEIRATPPHLRPFRHSTPASPHDHRAMPSQRSSSSSLLSQTSAQPLTSQTPPPLPTNHNTNPTQNSPRSSPVTSSQPVVPPALPSSHSWHPQPLTSQTPPPLPTNDNTNPTQNSPRSSPITSSQPVAPPASVQLPSSHSWHPPGTRPATSSSHSQVSLPPMPSVSISHSGLYKPTPPDLPMDNDKQDGLHPPNTSPSPPVSTDLGKEGTVVCLSDDDDSS
ncbi:putative DNA helicase [Helianthus debilis subsp. tardiflorus]